MYSICNVSVMCSPNVCEKVIADATLTYGNSVTAHSICVVLFAVFIVLVFYFLRSKH